MIEKNVKKILAKLPKGVELVGAAKNRTADEILQAIAGGINIVGENYLQEAKKVFQVIGKRVEWQFIGHLQTNKVKEAVEIFDMIQTVDSLKIAREIDKRCKEIGKIMPILMEINSAGEKQKFGVLPEEAMELMKNIADLDHLKIMGIMTMGPLLENSEDYRPYFQETRRVFEEMKRLNLKKVDMKYLSMGMTDSYRVAIEEGANMVRIGTKIFGRRQFV